MACARLETKADRLRNQPKTIRRVLAAQKQAFRPQKTRIAGPTTVVARQLFTPCQHPSRNTPIRGKNSLKNEQKRGTNLMAGRGKKKQISDADMRKAETYAFGGHKNNTICELMGWGHNLIEDRPDIRKRLSKKRAERKVWLRSIQDRQATTVPAMAIFLGKNELEQSDKQDHNLGGDLHVHIDR